MGDPRPPLARNFVSALRTNRISGGSGKTSRDRYRNIDNVDDKICQLSGIVCGEIVTSTLNKKQLTIEFGLESLKGTDVGGDILSDSSVGAPSSLNGLDAFRRKGVILYQELLVLAGEDVVGHDG